jgi:phospholipase/lecithinase/hemolysin
MKSLIASVVTIVVLIALPTGGFGEDLPAIREVVSFGDSLSDAGTYWFRFTTNPGLTFAQHLALRYGQIPLPNEHMDRYADAYQGRPGLPGPGGLNYSEGGSKANSAYSAVSQIPDGVPISAREQLNRFFRQYHRFSANQLVTLFIGTNDVAYNYDPTIAPDIAKQLRENVSPSPATMQAETKRVQVAADDTARIARDILEHGAKRLVVLELYDLGQAPWFQSRAAQTYATRLTKVFNAQLLAALPKNPEHLLVVDTASVIADFIANGARYGFRHTAHEDACGTPDHDYCFPESEAAPDADQTYVFAAGEHLTTLANRLLAEAVIKQLNASPLK